MIGQKLENPSKGIKHEISSPISNSFSKGGKKKVKVKDNRPYIQFRKKTRMDLF